MQTSLFPRTIDERPLDLLAALNEAQRQAVEAVAGPFLVIAGAGSGKTRTLVYRVARLIQKGVPPEHILLLTFTRRAAQEMLDRARLLADASCSRVMGGTFHAMASLQLRRYGHYVGFAPNFTILDRSDAEDVVNLLRDSLGFSGGGRHFPNKRTILALLSKAVNRAVPLSELLEDEYAHLAEHEEELQALDRHYKTFKRDHGLMDYDDLLTNWMAVLEQEEQVRREVSQRFSYIMVDEYQDTNRVQAGIVRLMAATHDNVMAVGDDSQSIYSFRGANFRNILDYPKLFPGTQLIKLEENYRSTQPILSFANAIIASAEEKYTKSLFTKRAEGELPVLFGARNDSEQSRFIAEAISGMRAEGKSLADMAVLFRSGFHSFNLELELNARKIPFEKRGGLKLTETAHIKDVIAHLRILTNPRDYLSWNRILLLIEKVGPKTAQTIINHLRTVDDPFAGLAAYKAGPSWKAGLKALVETLAKLKDDGLSPLARLNGLLDYYGPLFERIYHDDFPKRKRELEQLKVLIHEYEKLQDFLDDVTLDPIETGADQDQTGDRLVLSTIHSAKGLEWEAVFIINLVEGFFPSAHAVIREELEEERRLFYVAVTRAKSRLYLTYPRQMMTADRQFRSTDLSPFIVELPPGLLTPLVRPASPPPSAPPPRSAFSSPAKRQEDRAMTVGVGAIVRHAFFGEGQVTAIAGPRTVEVLFPRHGTKTLHLDYAKLETIRP